MNNGKGVTKTVFSQLSTYKAREIFEESPYGNVMMVKESKSHTGLLLYTNI